ncbi:VOC family protein [Nocardia sp. NPDC005978]|uniref:VOC family protein n=1 Tax=Nocardia sp. NPDC005978 TaxID=3156725 RepID=UPI0033B15CCF
MLTTRFVTGSPNWIDVSTPDIEAAAAFYTGLLGWTFAPGGAEFGGYSQFLVDGKSIGGAMQVTADQGEPGWTVYFQSPDTDTTAKAVAANGGSVLAQPMDVGSLGRMAVYADPAGVAFASWQPGDMGGLEAVTTPGSLSWLELYTGDTTGAQPFYNAVFGHDFTAVEMPEGAGEYTTVNPADQGPDGMFAGIVPLDSDPVEAATGPYWLAYFEVEDVDAVVAKALELGGAVRSPAVTMAGAGRFAKLSDPFGARFGVIRSESQPG